MKAAHILDAAEDLLTRYGYRRVTVDEVARGAGVGKGTVYLYWPSKRELFAAVLTRDAARLLSDQLTAMLTDPAEVLPHRSMRWTYLAIMDRPLAKALYTGDSALLGDLTTASRSGALFAAGKRETTDRYLSVLHGHGLLSDEPGALLSYRLSAAVAGSFHLDGTPDTAEFGLTAKADALATTVRRAFEPAEDPAPAAVRDAAADMADVYRQWLAELTRSLPREQS
ncbi:MAG: TetR/AcrR family transcriptional regulator [Kutzneria sp.]|nr:TetR/AcrR family transcriptional regulator [Kutzneria sp.]